MTTEKLIAKFERESKKKPRNQTLKKLVSDLRELEAIRKDKAERLQAFWERAEYERIESEKAYRLKREEFG